MVGGNLRKVEGTSAVYILALAMFHEQDYYVYLVFRNVSGLPLSFGLADIHS
jgi:hypothetical protein